MGLRAGPWTPQAREVIALLGTVLPFEQVPRILAKVNGLRVSASTVRAVTEAAGAALCLAVEAEWAQLQRELPDPVGEIATCQISVDGAMVSVVGEGWREVPMLSH